LLQELGVPWELQALFNSTDCVFDFGDGYEHFRKDFHHVPTSQNVWRAVPDVVKDVVITHSAMKAIAFMHFNRHLFTGIEQVAFAAIGNFPHSLQTGWIRHNFRKRKITLAFGNYILGVIADIKVSAGRRLMPVKLCHEHRNIIIECKSLKKSFEQDTLSLSVFEKEFGIRSGIRTSKPQKNLTYLDQLTTYGK
jgi:hypothetical protein